MSTSGIFWKVEILKGDILWFFLSYSVRETTGTTLYERRKGTKNSYLWHLADTGMRIFAVCAVNVIEKATTFPSNLHWEADPAPLYR